MLVREEDDDRLRVHIVLENISELQEFKRLWMRAINTLEPAMRSGWVLELADKVDEIVDRHS